MLPVTCLPASLAAPRSWTWGSWGPEPQRWAAAPRSPSAPTPAASGSAQTPFLNVLAKHVAPRGQEVCGGAPRGPPHATNPAPTTPLSIAQ